MIKTVAGNTQERILIVESDPLISDLISRQALKSAGYQTQVVGDTSSAIAKSLQYAPDAVIVDLALPGLSGKDLLVAFNSQNIQTPVIILGRKGSEADIIQAFRLGAADYLIWPLREAEVINVVERVLKQVRERHERDRLAQQLQQTNQELQARVREMTTLMSVGKAVSSITDQALLLERVVGGAKQVTQADMSWCLLREEASKKYIMVAQRDLPASVQAYMNQPFDDGISQLVAMSGESLSLHGDSLKRFRIASLGGAAMIAPVKVQKQVIGLLVVVRRQPAPFTPSEQHLLEAVADTASTSLVNARLFKTIEERARTQQNLAESAMMGEKIINEMLQNVKKELRAPSEAAQQSYERLVRDPAARWSIDQRQALSAIQDQMEAFSRIVEAIMPLPLPQPGQNAGRVKLTDLAAQAANRYQHFAQQSKVTLVVEPSSDPLLVEVNPTHILQVLEGLLSNAIKYCNAGGQVAVRLKRTPEGLAHVMVADNGMGMDAAQLGRIFEPAMHNLPGRTRHFGGLGIGLPLARELVTANGGKIWAESKPGQGASFHITLPAVR
jgi:signal transduction histidine kinase/DNA-binding response OmpR family regulator